MFGYDEICYIKGVPTLRFVDIVRPQQSAAIRFGVPKSCHVNLTICDLLGKEISTLVDEVKHSGEYSVVWDGQGNPTGIYLARLIAGDHIETRKLILQK